MKLIGGLVGVERGFMLRLQVQNARCQVTIDQTRAHPTTTIRAINDSWIPTVTDVDSSTDCATWLSR